MTLVMLPGLALLAVGAAELAQAISRSVILPRWAGIIWPPASPCGCPCCPGPSGSPTVS